MSARLYRLPIGIENANLVDMNPTFKDLVDFVMANKGTKTFVGYSDERIIAMLHEGIREQSLYYETGLDGHITGMILAVFCPTRKLAFVTENLAMDMARLKRFAQKLHDNYPDYSIGAIRHGREVYFDTPKLYNKLIKL